MSDDELCVRHAWLQKHPSPTARGGEFHWHPPMPATAQPESPDDRAAGPASWPERPLRDDLRLDLVDRLRGVAPPAVLWQLAPGRVVWAQVFAATAPGDGRRYCGLAVSIAERAGVPAADLLASLVVPVAGPWDGGACERVVPLVRAVAAPASATQRVHVDTVLPAAVAVAHALLHGGSAPVADSTRPDLPAWLAALEAWLPATITSRPRRGEWRGLAPLAGTTGDRVAALLVDAWLPATDTDPTRTARAWNLLVEIAACQNRSLEDVASDLERDEGRTDLAIAPWVRELNAWGRRARDDDGTTLARLADVVALRSLADHVEGRSERASIDRVRWHALLPAARRQALLAAVRLRVPSLAPLIDADPFQLPREEIAHGHA